MSKRIKIIIALLLVVSLALSFSVGCTLGVKTSPSTNGGLATVEEAWGIIFQDYVEREKLDSSALSQGAIKGMVEALADPYTAYLNPETYRLSLSSLAGKFEGIGAYVDVKDKQLTIIAPLGNSPAAQAGIKAGDIILEINGQPASEMSLEGAVLLIRGPKGTPVKLLILHPGEAKPEEIEVIRAEVKITSVYSEMKGDIAYINISSFAERTSEELSSALESAAQEGASGIILDLRHNPGGLLEAVVDVASRFSLDGVVVYTVDSQGQRSPLSVKPEGISTSLPLVVLTDNFSASGSEVLAGALQDYGRATIAGKQTFGKGSVNTLRQLKDGSALYITTSRWLTPKGRVIEGKGIIPDYELELEGDEAIQWAIDYLKGKK